MKKDPKLFIYHILESIELIEAYSKGITRAQFLKKSSVQDAIIRRLEIIGEAVKNLPDTFKINNEIYPFHFNLTQTG